jgi:hypothetical protein
MEEPRPNIHTTAQDQEYSEEESSSEEDDSSSDPSISVHFNARLPSRAENSPLNLIQEEIKLLRL